MHYTREPIIESIITPREGHKLVVRSSRGGEQEEYLVEALEVVSFNTALFFRSVERPKCFLLPVAEYEVLEVRETRMVLKHASTEEKGTSRKSSVSEEERPEKKSRRRRSRRRTTGAEESSAEELPGEEPAVQEPTVVEQPPTAKKVVDLPPLTLLPPPTELISETIEKYKAVVAMEQEPSEPASESADEEDWEELRLEPPAEGEPRKGLFASSRLLQRLTGQESFSSLPPPEDDDSD